MKSKVKDLPINNPPDEEIIPLEETQPIVQKKAGIRTTINESSQSKRTSKRT